MSRSGPSIMAQLEKEHAKGNNLHANCEGCHHITPRKSCVYRIEPKMHSVWPCWFRVNCSAKDAQDTIILTAEIMKATKGLVRQTPFWMKDAQEP